MANLENDIINNQVNDVPVGVPDDQFTFQTIADLEVPPELKEFDKALDPEYEQMLAQHSDLVNKFAMPASHNYNSPYPAPATGKYNVDKQHTPPNLSTMEGKLRLFNDIHKQAPKVEQNGIFGRNDLHIADPIYAGIRESQFDKYYASPAYSELGWHPYANMEKYYNENTSWWDDAGRMFVELGGLMGTGYASSYRSWFDTDSAMDLQSAVEYEDAIRIGSSTKSGFGAGLNNFLLNSGYTFGIIGSIAVEELLMWGATAAATVLTAPAGGAGGVAVGAAAVARTGWNMAKLAKLGRRIANSFSLGKMAAGTRAIVANLKNIDAARDFWSVAKGGGNVLGKMLIPETMSAFKNLKTAQKAGENLTFMAKNAKRLGGFYRDARSLNFALSEGRMEGGMVYKEQLATNFAIQAEKNRAAGIDGVTPEQMRDLSEQAHEAAFVTSAWNVPLIYLSNQLLLGNAFGGFKRSLGQVMRDNIEGVGKRILKTKATVETVKGGGKKLAKDVFEDAGESFMNWKYLKAKIKAGGAKGGAVMAAGAGLRYFANNVAEGLQEVYQEAVSAGVKDYYTNLAFDPLNGNVQQMKASALSGAGTQWGGQGLETFASGFFMGGVVGGPQKIVFESMPMMYQRTFNKAEYAEYKAKKEELITNTLESLNNSWNSQVDNVDSMFDTDTLNFLEQKQAAAAMEEAQINDNVFDFVDAQDNARFLSLHRMFTADKQDFFREQLQDYLKLSNQELAEAFPSEAKSAKSGKLREKIQSQVEKLDRMEENYNANKEEMENPFAPEVFEKGSREYNDEAYKKWAFEHARMLYMFTKDGFIRAGERAQSIYNELESDPILKEIAANDITVLLNKDTLTKEINQLTEEIKGLGEPGTKLLKKDKEKKLEKLKAIADVLYADENQTLSSKDKRFDRRKTSKLMPKVLAYLKTVAKTKNDFVDESRIKKVLNMIIDHNHLSSRQRVYDKAIEFLNNPEQMDLIVRRSYEYIKFAHRNKLEMQRELVEKMILRKEINQLLNEFNKLGVYADTGELLEFARTGNPDVLTIFHTENGVLNPVDDPKLYNRILNLIDVFRQSSGAKIKAEKKAAAEKAASEQSAPSASETKSAIDELLDQEGVDAPEVKIYGKGKDESPVLDKILQGRYNQYRAAQISLGGAVPTFEEFLETALAKNIVTAYTGLKKLWYQTLTNIESEDIRMSKYNQDTGFLDWLAVQETNDVVAKIIDESNLSWNFFLPDFKESQGSSELEDTESIVFEGKNVDIFELESFDATVNKRTKYYQIRNKNGDIVAEDIISNSEFKSNPTLTFTDRAKAIKAARKVDPLVPNYETFDFGGQSLQFGARVKDKKTGKYFIVLATPSDLKSGRIYVLNEDYTHLLGDRRKRNAAAEKGTDGKIGLNESEFEARFVIEDINVGTASLPENASKLRVDEATALVPHQNDRNTPREELEELSWRRYAFIIQNLSKKELESLEIEVTTISDAGKDLGLLKFKDKEINPFITKTRSSYNIAVKLPEALRNKINGKLRDQNLNAPTDGIIGWIPNADVILSDRNGNPIDPLNIEADQIPDLFNTSLTNEIAAQQVANNFAIQYTIMNAIKDKLGGKSEGNFTLKDIGGVDFFTTPGYVNFLPDGETTAISKLFTSKVKGKTVILKNTKVKGVTTTTFMNMGLSPKEAVAFEEKMKEEMNAQNENLFSNASTAGRYVMIVQQDNGVYSYFPIKSENLEDAELNTLAENLIKRSEQTTKENIKKNEDGGSTTDNLNYNDEWNQNFNNGEIEGSPAFYIASVPGYSFDINVTAKGQIQLKIYDRSGKVAISVLMKDVAAISEYKNSENKSELLKDLFELAKVQLKDGPAKLKKDTPTARKEAVRAAAKLEISIDSIRKSFAPNAAAEEMASKSVTSVVPTIRSGGKMVANIDGVDAMQMKAAGINVGPSVPPGPPGNPRETKVGEHVILELEGNKGYKIITPAGNELDGVIYKTKEDAMSIASELDNILEEDSIDPIANDLNMLSNEEFNELKEKDFVGLTNDQKNFIADKLAKEEKLSNRELQVLNKPSVAGQINLMAAKMSAVNSPEGTSNNTAIKEDSEAKLRKDLKKIEADIEARESKLHADTTTKSEYRDALKNDSKLKGLNKKKSEILSKLAANKVVSENLSDEEVQDINEFLQWATINLPEFITIENIDTLGDNMKSGGERVGAFVMALSKIAGKQDIKGIIYAGSSTKHAYHEAFHAVFRMLLTEEQQKQYYSIARKEVLAKLRLEGKNLKDEIQKLKNSDIQKYKNLSPASLEKLFYEEYMADEFEKFKQNPKSSKTNSWIKSLFNKILEWVRNVLGRYNATELQVLFEDINAGRFRSSQSLSNPFTDAAASGVTLDASKIIRSKRVISESGYEYDVNLDPEVGRGIVSSIAARVIMQQLDSTDPNWNIVDSVQESIDLYRKLYDVDNPQYINNSKAQDDLLFAINDSFQDFGRDFYEAVLEELNLYDIKLELTQDEDGEFEQAYGLRTTEQYDKDASMTGGFRSLPSFIRKYIGTTTVTETDAFGNDYLNPETGERIIVPVDFGVAYSGFLKASANQTDPIRILQQLYLFGVNNPQTRAVVERLFNDLGLTWEGQIKEGILPGTTKKNDLFQAILNGFENAKVDYLFIHRVLGTGKDDPKANTVITYDAANRDDAHDQIAKWADAYKSLRKRFDLDPGLKDTLVKKLALFMKYLPSQDDSSSELSKITDKELGEISKEMAELIQSTLGIALSPQYIAFSIASNVTDLTAYQSALISANKDAQGISYGDVEQMRIGVAADANIMSEEDDGMYSRLRRLSLGNSNFDERVGASIFRNPNGDLVYAHQLPTFHLKKVRSLNDVEGKGAVIEELAQKDPYLATNFLLKSPAMKALSAEGRLKITRLAGSKSSRSIEKDENGGITEKYDRNEEGTVYGDYNPQEFLNALLSAYISGVNPRSGRVNDVVPEDSNDGIALAPVLIRVIEASNTGDMINLPVIKAVVKSAQSKFKVSDEAMDIAIGNIETEMNRIIRELNPETATWNDVTQAGVLKVGYNADKTGQSFDENGRAFKFSNNGQLLKSRIKAASQDETTVNVEHSPSVAERLQTGGQTMYIMSDAGAQQANFQTSDQERQILLQGREYEEVEGKKKKVKKLVGPQTLHTVLSKGKISVDGIDQAEILLKFGDALSKDKTETFKYKVNFGQGVEPRYVESADVRDFLNGKKEAYLYEVIDTAQEENQSDVSIDFATRLENLLKENSKLPAEEQVVYTLDSALEAIGESKESLKDFVERRLDENFKEFEIEVNKQFGPYGLPRFVSEGLKGNLDANTNAGNVAAANRKLNLTDNKTHNLKQMYISNFLNTTAINEILLGDQAMSLKDAVDAVKRAKMQNAAYYSAASRIAAPELGVKKATQKISLFATTEPIGTSIYSGEDIEVADAQNWMTVKAFRYMFFGFGKLTKSQAALLDKIEDGADISVDEIFGQMGAAKKQEMLNSKKLVYGDGKIFDKFSVIPLTKALTSYKNEKGEWVARPDRVKLHNMRVKMESFEQQNDTIAMTAPLSALKMMKENVTPIDDFVDAGVSDIWQSDSKGSTDQYMDREISTNAQELSVDQSMTLDANFMGLQVLNPSNKLEIVDPTQVKTILTGEQDDKAKVILNGEEVSVGQLRAAYNKAVADRMVGKHLDKRNLTFSFDADYASDELHKSIKEGAITVDLLNYLQYAQTSLKASQSASELIDFFTFDEETGEQKYELNNPIVIAKFEQLFLSYFGKGVVSEKIPGTSAALLSDFGNNVYRRVLTVDENGYPDQQEIIRSDDFLENYSVNDLIMRGENPLDFSDDQSFDALKVEVEKSKGKGVIILDRLRSNMKEYKDGKFTGIKYTESLLPAHKKDVYRDVDRVPGAPIPDVLSKMFGIRIPSQDNHSTVNIKVVDFLPVFYGSTIMSARELVEVSGADFDIDKLYIQMKTYYQENGEFIEYSDSYKDYVRWVNDNVNKKGTIYAEAAFKASKGMDEGLTDNEIKSLREEGLHRKSVDALTELKLPRSEKEFNAYIEKNKRVPFSAGINNTILDQKIALMGNSAVTESNDGSTPISYEAADIKILLDVWNEISTEIPELAEAANEDDVNPNDMHGQFKGFTNNKAGAKSIGAAVLPNLYLSLLQEYDSKIKSLKTTQGTEGIKLTFNGLVYRSFSNENNKEVLEDGSTGRRKQYIISALITAMTDNAKERLAAKLGLSRDALAIVTNMTAMGVPIKTSILLMNNPYIRRIYELQALSSDPALFDVGKEVEIRQAALSKALKNYDIDLVSSDINVNQNTLADSIKNKSVAFDSASELEAKLEKLDEDSANPEGMVRDIEILNQFQNALAITKFTRNMGVILNLTNGYGQTIAEFDKVDRAIKALGLNLSNAEYNKLNFKDKPLIDVRPMLSGNTWQSKMLEIYQELSKSLAPKVFLTESSVFKSIENSLIDNAVKMSKEDKAKVRRDLLSYVTLKAWVKLSAESDSPGANTLSNNIIYDTDSNNNIGAIVEKAREANGSKYNAFLNDFIRIEKATDQGNKTGITIIASNTLTPLNDSQKINIQNGFKELFINPETRSYAMSILNYLMVKDGLQPTYKTLLSAISPSMLGRYLDSIGTVREAFARSEDSQELLNSVFGMTKEELREDFVFNYLLSAKTAPLVQKKSKAISVYNPKSQVKTQGTNFTIEQVRANPDTLFVIFDNEAGVGSTYGKIVREEPNVVSIKVKKNNSNTPSDFYTEGAESNAKIQDITKSIEEIQALRLSFKDIIFPSKLNDAERNGLRENSEDVHDHLATVLESQFGYRINGVAKEKVGEDKSKKKKSEPINKEARNKPIYIDRSAEKDVLTIDLNKGVGKPIKFSGKISERVQPRPEGKKERTLILNNIDTLYKAGFRTVEVERNNIKYKEVLFPSVISVGNKLFILARLAGSNMGDNFITDKNNIAVGSYAQYIEVDRMGSSAQFPAGFAFDNLRTTKEVQAIVKEANPSPEDGNYNSGQAPLEEYNKGMLPGLDAVLQQRYEEVKAYAIKAGVTPLSFDDFVLTDTGQKIINTYMNNIDDTESTVTREADGSVHVNGRPLNDLKSQIKEAEESGEREIFNIPGAANPEDNNFEEDADPFGGSESAELQINDWYNNLSVKDQIKLEENSKGRLASAKDLVKESKKNHYKGSVKEFLDEINQCFL